MPSRQLDINNLVLCRGGHAPGEEMCLMEAVTYVAGEEWSDRPNCASKVIGTFLRSWNDGMNDTDCQMLKPLIPRIVGTAASREVELARSRLALQWMIRVHLPAWLDLAKLTNHASNLRTCQDCDIDTFVIAAGNAADAALDAAMDATWDGTWDATWFAARDEATWDATWFAARDAARGAAWVAAWVASRGAARDEVWGAARDEVWDVAWDAARVAAWDAARVAAQSTLRPIVVELQKSALYLVDRMICIDTAA